METLETLYTAARIAGKIGLSKADPAAMERDIRFYPVFFIRAHVININTA